MPTFDRGLVCVGVEDHHVGAVGLLGLVGHDAVSGLEHRHVGVDVVVVGQTQRVDLLAQLDQALDVVTESAYWVVRSQSMAFTASPVL